jgi:D-beta-D-heptose 7-phosphate kinase/D-beta-D-heptose 1-phosphate adenosyltransferase
MNNNVIFTNGCFDILHTGHVQLLKECKKLAGDNGKVIVGLNSDASVKNLKGDSRPINDQDSRKLLLESLRFVDEVIIFEEDTPELLVEKICPDILVKGGDYLIDQIVGKQYAKKVVVFPYVDGKSTTNTIEKLSKSFSHRR